jgi:hypothetical protein
MAGISPNILGSPTRRASIQKMMGCKPYQTRFEPKNLRVSATGLLPTHQIQEGEDNKEVNQVNSTSSPLVGIMHL